MAAKKAEAKKTGKKPVKKPVASRATTASAKKPAAKTAVPAKKPPVKKATPAKTKVVAKKATPAKTKVVAKKGTPAKKAAAKKAPAARTTTLVSSSPVNSEGLLAQLAKQTGLSADQVLERALTSFATAHGFSLPVSQAAVETIETTRPAAEVPVKTPPAQKLTPSDSDSEPFDDSHLPSLGPDVRLYVHAAGRIPQEMLNDTYIIGASPKCDLSLRYPQVEMQHLRIVREGRHYFAEDLNTTKGSVVHGEKVTRYQIKHEDDIYLAGFLKVRFYLIS